MEPVNWKCRIRAEKAGADDYDFRAGLGFLRRCFRLGCTVVRDVIADIWSHRQLLSRCPQKESQSD